VSVKKLVLIAHGSRDARWREPVERIFTAVSTAIGGDAVRLVYMELSSPRLQDVAVEASMDGTRTLLVLPLFLAAGGHVDREIAFQCEDVRKLHPQLQVELLPPLGAHPEFVDFVARIGREHLGDA
jgi:sirohydrochlorin cobaltochelatase